MPLFRFSSTVDDSGSNVASALFVLCGLREKSFKILFSVFLIKHHSNYSFASCDYVKGEVKYGHFGTKTKPVSPSVRPQAAFN